VETFTLTLPAFAVLALAAPLVLGGEQVVERVGWLRRLSVPASVIGGLFAALALLAINGSGLAAVTLVSRTAAAGWSWLVTIEPLWADRPMVGSTLPLMVAFFTCVGLNASWEVLKPGAWLVLRLLGLATILAVVQNVVGLLVAKALGVSPLLGLVCAALTLTGGPGSAVSFSPEIERLGLTGAVNFALAAATFGIVAGGLVGGPVGSWLIRRHGLNTPGRSEQPAAAGVSTPAVRPRAGLLHDVRQLVGHPLAALAVLGVLIACMKAGAWLTFYLQKAGLFFALQIGAMIVGVIVRNLHDLAGGTWIRTATVQAWSNALLALFITAAMMTINLRDLAAAGGPMLILLLTQIAVAVLFVVFVTYRFMGRDYDAAVIGAGHIGFGLGITANAVANMQTLTLRHGPSPRAFLAVPIVGAFLIDFTNGLLVTLVLQWVGGS
jgi:ESS family glutamate:Na+ symporter